MFIETQFYKILKMSNTNHSRTVISHKKHTITQSLWNYKRYDSNRKKIYCNKQKCKIEKKKKKVMASFISGESTSNVQVHVNAYASISLWMRYWRHVWLILHLHLQPFNNYSCFHHQKVNIKAACIHGSDAYFSVKQNHHDEKIAVNKVNILMLFMLFILYYKL